MKWTCLFSAGLFLLATVQPGTAQIKVDMNKVTCGNFLGYDPDDQNFVRYWMSGYYNGAANRTVLDYDRMQRNSAKVKAYCKKHKSETLPTAIKKAAS